MRISYNRARAARGVVSAASLAALTPPSAARAALARAAPRSSPLFAPRPLQEGVLLAHCGGSVKRSPPPLVSGVDSRARLQQRQEVVLSAPIGGKVKRSGPVLASGVDSRALLIRSATSSSMPFSAA